MYRRILVPVDGSAASLSGLKQAIALGRDQRASVRIVHIVDELGMASMMVEPSGALFEDLLESMRAEGKKVLQKALATAKSAGVDAEAVQIASGGRAVSDAILKEARRGRADVIVMGTHGRRGLNRLLLGSDAERVLRDATVPVLLTRQPERKRPSSSSRGRAKRKPAS